MNVIPDAYTSTVDMVISRARVNLERDGELLPVAFLCRDHNITIVGTPFSNRREKQAQAQVIRMMAKEMRAEFALFVAEVWFIKKTLGEPLDASVQPSASPERIEGVMFILSCPAEDFVGIAETKRAEGAAPTFGDVEWTAGKSDGIFANIIGGDSGGEAHEEADSRSPVVPRTPGRA
jgi:hypothetical protein